MNKIGTVQELIDKLQNVEDKTLEVNLEGCDCILGWNGEVEISDDSLLWNYWLSNNLAMILAKFDNSFPNKIQEVVDDFGSPIKSNIKEFIAQALSQTRQETIEECIGKIEKYFNGLIVISDPQATKDNILQALEQLKQNK